MVASCSVSQSYPSCSNLPVSGFLLIIIFSFISNIDDEFEKEFEDSLTDPDEEESTELGEVPHADQKGSIRPGYIYSPYGISSIYRYE